MTLTIIAKLHLSLKVRLI